MNRKNVNMVSLTSENSNFDIELKNSKQNIFVDVTIKGETTFFIFDYKKMRFRNLLGDKHES